MSNFFLDTESGKAFTQPRELAAGFPLDSGHFSPCLDFTGSVKQTSGISDFFLEEQAPQKL